jgi:hypothetical protein
MPQGLGYGTIFLSDDLFVICAKLLRLMVCLTPLLTLNITETLKACIVFSPRLCDLGHNCQESCLASLTYMVRDVGEVILCISFRRVA